MALSTKEGTKQSTMDILSGRVGLPVLYARIYDWKLNRLDPSFSAELDLFVTDPPGENTPLRYGIGCNLRYPEDFEALSRVDDRALLYRHIEYILNYQEAQSRQQADPGSFDMETESEKLDALASSLGIETLFHLTAVTGGTV